MRESLSRTDLKMNNRSGGRNNPERPLLEWVMHSTSMTDSPPSVPHLAHRFSNAVAMVLSDFHGTYLRSADRSRPLIIDGDPHVPEVSL